MHFFLLIAVVLLTRTNARYHRLKHIRLENSYCDGYTELRDGDCSARFTSCSSLTPEELKTIRQVLCGFRFNAELQTDPPSVQDSNGARHKHLHLPDIHETDAHSYPWLATIYSGERNFLCSGALISPLTVVTSAQCVSQPGGTTDEESPPEAPNERQSAPRLIVRLGEHHLNTSASYENVYEYDVESIDISQQYNELTHENDIAIIRLVSRVPVCLFPPIHIPRRNEWWLDINHIEGNSATYMGWGLTGQRRYLRALSGEVLSPNFCRILFNWDRNQLNRTHLCVDSPSGVCVSEVGGPLITFAHDRWVLIGIMTFGKHCRTPGLPLVFTRISEFVEDISRFIEEDFKTNNTTSPYFNDDCHKVHRHIHLDTF